MKYDSNYFKGYDPGALPKEPVAELEALSKIAASEGIVLLKNERETLPLGKGDTVSVFGRIQTEYYKSGTGSGGLVNVKYKTNILDSLRRREHIKVNEELAAVYEAWIKEHPFNTGEGWAGEPWCQEEMELDTYLVEKAAGESDKAVIIIGRTAGEDKDNSASEGSYFLTEKEEDMIKKVCSAFDKVCVVLNVGNIIDMKWVDKYGVSSVLYVWQGGMCGGDAAADVLTAVSSPCGKLVDTIAYSIEDYPSTSNFGAEKQNIYKEDIYVGYRYFETFAKDKVMYPFGYGLSYTKFGIKAYAKEKDGAICVKAEIENIGKFSGKEVLQVYFEAPQGNLGNPLRRLIGFDKTKLLESAEKTSLVIEFGIEKMASYDDSGAGGYKNCYVLEAGEYNIYAGTDVRSADKIFTYTVTETYVVKQCRECLTPVVEFERIKPSIHMGIEYEKTPTRTYSTRERIESELPKEMPYTADRGIKLDDVREGRNTLDEFIAQLNDEELGCIVRGEGMNSPKVTPGTGGCFGGVNGELLYYGIPIACVTDGPSGIRMDSGFLATSLPNGTCLACTFNRELVGTLYTYEGIEMTAYKIDAVLGPGVNIHRNPLNGRNFEYFSEDPYLTGEMAVAISKALNAVGVSCTVKHFMANSQEWHRKDSDSVLSERAIREIYAYPFEIAVKEGKAKAIMTSYNLINGVHGASCYDLTTSLLRNEWGFDGFVMTDWWADISAPDGTVSRNDTASMIKAQNDVYMVVSDSKSYEDTIKHSLENGYLKRSELQRCAKNLCRYLMHTHAFERLKANGPETKTVDSYITAEMKKVYELENVKLGEKISICTGESGKYVLEIEISSQDSKTAQITTKAHIMTRDACYFVTQGSQGCVTKASAPIYLTDNNTEIIFSSSSPTLEIIKVALYK